MSKRYTNSRIHEDIRKFRPDHLYSTISNKCFYELVERNGLKLNSLLINPAVIEERKMAAVPLSAGAKEKRSILPHSRVMIHQPSGGVIHR